MLRPYVILSICFDFKPLHNSEKYQFTFGYEVNITLIVPGSEFIEGE